MRHDDPTHRLWTLSLLLLIGLVPLSCDDGSPADPDVSIDMTVGDMVVPSDEGIADTLADADADADVSTGYVWQLPAGFPVPAVPDDNPMSDAKVELGRHLFYDTRLSINGETSCGTCHQQDLAFTDGLANAIGTTGEVHRRSSMSLVNVAYNTRQTWSSPILADLEDQALLPLFGEEPVEMGLTGKEDALLAWLRADADYAERFPAAFPEADDPFTVASVVRAISAFQRTIIGGDSPYDRYLQGEADALSESAVRGMDLFFSERLECFHCHGGFNFTDSVGHDNTPIAEFAFHNTGLYNVDGVGAYPGTDTGLYELTGESRDMGRFRAPTLRNITLTAPYMHDGSVATLDDVIDHYAAGGRAEGEGGLPGLPSPLTSEFVSGGFILSDTEREDLKAFLESLTDETLLTDPRFADPFEGRELSVDGLYE